jgi:hypothetical protein
MLSLLPKSHHKFRALPLLGAIADGFDDGLAASGYTPGSRKFSIRFLRQADSDLRKRGVREIAELSRSILFDSWRGLINIFPNHAGTVRTLARYLHAIGRIETGAVRESLVASPARALSNEYASFLYKVRGCAASTVSNPRLVSRCFLEHPDSRSVAPGAVQPGDIESYITQAGQRLCRASLQHEVAGVRGFGSSLWMAECERDPIARSTLPACTGLSSCLARFPGTQSRRC